MKFSVVASKLIVEVRFRPNLAYFDEMFKIASSIEDEYEDWQASHNPSEGILTDATKKKVLKITSSTLTLILEDSAGFSSMPEEVHRMFLLFLEPTRISEIKRIGVRRSGIYETDSKYQVLTDGFFDAFYGNKDAIKSVAADEVGDISVILDGVKDGYKNHVRMGPLKPDQTPIYYRSDFSDKVEIKKETNLFLDVDVYSDVKTTYEDAGKTVNPVIETNAAIYDGLLDLVKKELPE
jgi:hypothetical protein